MASAPLPDGFRCPPCSPMQPGTEANPFLEFPSEVAQEDVTPGRESMVRSLRASPFRPRRYDVPRPVVVFAWGLLGGVVLAMGARSGPSPALPDPGGATQSPIEAAREAPAVPPLSSAIQRNTSPPADSNRLLQASDPRSALDGVTKSPPPQPLPTAAVQPPVARAAVRSVSTVARSTSARGAAGAVGFRGSLSVESQPSGARVTFNGTAAGTTPLVLERLPIGSHVVRVEHDGYKAAASAVRIVANQRARLTLALDPAVR